ALLEQAKSLQASTEQDDGRIALEFAAGVMPEFAPGKDPDYFQLWLDDGKVLARSPSLGARDLPRDRDHGSPPRFADVTLPDGRFGRRVEISFRPQVEMSGAILSPAPPGSPTVTLVVAQNRADLDAFLASLHLTLALGVLGLLAGLALLVKGVVAVGLRPLDDLARRLEAMDAGSLGDPVVIADAPAELVPTLRHLNGLLARLDRSFERERTFSANLAHEMRTPLAELRTITEVALKWPEDPASSAGALDEIRGIGLRLETVVVNLLALARCEGGEQTVRASQVPLRDLAAECWSAVAAEAEARRIAFAPRIPEGLTLVTDREKLSLILSNLFANAVAHGTPGGTVTCSAAVAAMSEGAGGEIVLRVANPAADLTEADLPRIFDRFWRKDSARSDGRHAGLGLSLVAALCDLLGFQREASLRDGNFEITLRGRIDGPASLSKELSMTLKSNLTISCFAGSLLLAGSLLAAPAAPGYKVLKEIPLGGEGGWDYLTVDPAGRRLYVSHSAKVTVIDVDSGKPVGDVEKLSGVHGIAIAHDLNRGFISNGKASTVTIFDLKTLATLSEVKVTGENPDAILYDPATARVFAFNGRSKNATVLDAKTGKVAGTIELGGKPEFATSDAAGKVFVNIEDVSEVVEIDAKALTVKAHWPLKPCESPSGMAIDRKHHRLLIGCENKMAAVMDNTNGKVVTTVPIGEGVDANGFDPGTGLGYSSNGKDGTLTVIREETPDRFTVAETVPTRKGARTMALDEKTHTVYLATAQFGPAPAATAEQPRPRPTILPNTFTILVVGH
ncbi:MAG TPA: ATP-binding protein, partial [Thermoanaerobaculia bacterium]